MSRMPRDAWFARVLMAAWLIGGALPDSGLAAPPAHPGADFDHSVARVLVRYCIDCHSGPRPQGSLDLTRKATTLAGGDSGPALIPGKPDESLLLQRVLDGEMPPKGTVSEADRNILKNWIATGAAWGQDPIDPFRVTTDHRAGYDWWALQPLAKPTPPTINAKTLPANWPGNAVDHFIAAKLAAQGLRPAAPADRRTLIRRLSFDLIGLPPTPQEAAAFVADPAPDATARLVDRLLASPHYGERWARHWLDVVAFAESNGFERDLPRDNAWHYRNWVIDALNADMPYDEFARWQIAGDVLAPNSLQASIATGFLVAGPHDTVLPVSPTMRAAMVQDELETLVGTVSQTFLGLTVHCARCHDHKFDPILQTDYYRLAASLAGVRHGEREIPQPLDTAKIKALQDRLADLQNQSQALERPARLAALAAGAAKPPSAVAARAEWDFRTGLSDRLGQLHLRSVGGAKLTDRGLLLDGRTGYAVSAPLNFSLTEKTLEAWVLPANLDQRGGGVIGLQTNAGNTFDSLVLGEQQPGRWMSGSEHFRRTQPVGGQPETQAATDPQATPIHIAIAYHSDGTIQMFRQGRPYGQAYRLTTPVTYPAGQAQILLGLRHEPAAANRHFAGCVVKARLYDRALTPAEIAVSAGMSELTVSDEALRAALTPADQARHTALLGAITETTDQLRQARDSSTLKIYTALTAQPPVTRRLVRGQVTDPAEPIAPGGIRTVLHGDRFGLDVNAPEAHRRLRLAQWVTSPDNPLFARVIVNRLWQWHMGRGLVENPSDMGFNGGRPSHPELLDWLASELIARRWSLKALHRIIVLSATYQQSGRPDPDSAAKALATDSDNRLLWRRTPTRLEAEAVRDAMLAVSGRLRLTVGGPGYRDFKSYFFKGSQFYEPLPDITPDAYRRTIYRMSTRGGRNPLLDVLDCPDPSTTTPRRAVTTTPLQALSLLHNVLVLHLADAVAERLPTEGYATPEAQVQRLWTLALGREPQPAELTAAAEFTAHHGLAALARVMFNTNEFLFVD